MGLTTVDQKLFGGCREVEVADRGFAKTHVLFEVSRGVCFDREIRRILHRDIYMEK
jgi:hypothetical protein